MWKLYKCTLWWNLRRPNCMTKFSFHFFTQTFILNFKMHLDTLSHCVAMTSLKAKRRDSQIAQRHQQQEKNDTSNTICYSICLWTVWHEQSHYIPGASLFVPRQILRHKSQPCFNFHFPLFYIVRPLCYNPQCLYAVISLFLSIDFVWNNYHYSPDHIVKLDVGKLAHQEIEVADWMVVK